MIGQLNKEITSCTACPLNENNCGKGKPTLGVGYPNPKNMLLGEAPGEKESQVGKPFVGKSGQLLQSCLRELDIKMGEIYVTNAVKHRPPKNRDPTVAEIVACSKHLVKEINIVKPKQIICLGRKPTQALHVIQGIKLPKGSLRNYKFEYQEITCVSIWHPAYICRNMNKKSLFLQDLASLF